MLKEAGVVDTLQEALNLSHKFLPSKDEEKTHIEASKHTLKEFLKRKGNEKILDKFTEFALENALETIVKEMDLKPDESYEPDEMEKMLVELSKIFGKILK